MPDSLATERDRYVPAEGDSHAGFTRSAGASSTAW
jgi:hypothetical protein